PSAVRAVRCERRIWRQTVSDLKIVSVRPAALAVPAVREARCGDTAATGAAVEPGAPVVKALPAAPVVTAGLAARSTGPRTILAQVA
ncbi:hypothetical protein, partial [Mycolicibacterium sphagni]|uniref:hypothetical protein n=1 Tax=Mycolicibacterium sphagni TaxID=1786 RepID=UPI001A9C352B